MEWLEEQGKCVGTQTVRTHIHIHRHTYTHAHQHTYTHFIRVSKFLW